MKFLFKLSALILCLISSSSFAGETQVRGFGTLGAVQHDSDTLEFRRDLGLSSEKSDTWSLASDSILGIQVDHQFSEQWSAAGQLVYKNRVDQTLDNSLEWAYLRYSPDLLPITIRLGRTAPSVFMLSDYRNVGFAYLWARPPVEFYGPLAFDSIEGIDFSYTSYFEEAFFRARLTLGQVENNFLEKEIVIEASPMATTSLLWEIDQWKFHFGYAYLDINKTPSYFNPLIAQLELIEPFWPGASEIKDRLDIKGTKFNFYSAGVAYDSANWTAQAEINRIETEGSIFTSSQSAYISLGRRLGDWTIYSIAALSENTDEVYEAPIAPPPFTALRNFAQNDFSSVGMNQKSLGIGARWDMTNNTALKMQWDHVWLEPYGAGLWGTEVALSQKEQIDVISISLNFLF